MVNEAWLGQQGWQVGCAPKGAKLRGVAKREQSWGVWKGVQGRVCQQRCKAWVVNEAWLGHQGCKVGRAEKGAKLGGCKQGGKLGCVQKGARLGVPTKVQSLGGE